MSPHTSSKQALGLINPKVQGLADGKLTVLSGIHPRGVFQKAGYVTYPGKFEDERADKLGFRFQNRRLLLGYVSNHSNLLSEDNLLRSRLCSRVIVHFSAISAR